MNAEQIVRCVAAAQARWDAAPLPYTYDPRLPETRDQRSWWGIEPMIVAFLCPHTKTLHGCAQRRVTGGGVRPASPPTPPAGVRSSVRDATQRALHVGAQR